MLLFEVLENDYTIRQRGSNNCNGNNHCTLPS